MYYTKNKFKQHVSVQIAHLYNKGMDQTAVRMSVLQKGARITIQTNMYDDNDVHIAYLSSSLWVLHQEHQHYPTAHNYSICHMLLGQRQKHVNKEVE